LHIKNRSLGETTFEVFNTVFMIIFSLLCIYPFVYILNISISEGSSAAEYGLHLIPKGVTLKYYKFIFSTDAIMMGFLNSVIRTFLGTTLMVMFTVMGAYPLSKKYMPNRRFWTTFILITMFFNGGLIPNYFLIKNLYLLDKIWALILPGLVNTFYLIVTRNFMMTIPDSLEESAKIDGANDLKILIHIILPVCKPILATIALWSAVWHWNSWFDSLIYISNPKLTVLQVILFRIINAGSSVVVTGSLTENMPYPDVIKSCTIIVTLLPIVAVYPFLQKYFIKGMLIGSVKG